MTEAEMKAKKDAEEAERIKKDAEEAAKKKADAEAGEAVDKLLACVDSLSKRMDAWEEDEKKKADATKADAAKKKDGETEGPDFMKKDADETEEAFEKRKDKARKDRARKDAEAEMAADKAKKDAEEDEKKKADADLDARIDARAKEMLSAIEKKIPRAMDDAEHEKMATAQARADSVFAAFGKRAPRPLDGETLLGYRRRLATELKVHSKDWREVDLCAIADSGPAFDNVERVIYADAAAVARNPIDLGDGELREVVRADGSGRQIAEFVGHPSSWMQQFGGSRRAVAGIRTKSNV